MSHAVCDALIPFTGKRRHLKQKATAS